jgi:hypothetical protein
LKGLPRVAGSARADADSCGELQAACGETVAARVVFVGFGASNDVKKRGGARAWAARRGQIIIWHANSIVS